MTDLPTLKDLKEKHLEVLRHSPEDYVFWREIKELVRQHIRYYETAYLRVHGEDVDEYGRPCVCVNCCMARQFIKALETLLGGEV